MKSHVDRVILSSQQIARRVAELGEQITRDYSPEAIGTDAKIVILPVMTGAMLFCADLIRHLPLRLRIGTIRVSSYPGTSTSSQGIKLVDAKLDNVAGRHVLVVDDILDSGRTLNFMRAYLGTLDVASVRTCVLVRKDRPEARATPVDYVGFDIPDLFVVGYGLDYDDYYRNFPDLVSLKPQYTTGVSS